MTSPYCLGFAIRDGYVALVKKNRPEWQAGKINGIGGRIEKDEDPRKAMVREFKEETGIDSKEDDWKLFCTMNGMRWIVYCYCTFTINPYDVKTKTDEEIFIFKVEELPDNVLHNLRWLIPLALDKDRLHAEFWYQ